MSVVEWHNSTAPFIRKGQQEGQPNVRPSSEDQKRVWFPSLIVYDTGMCTKEEHDPAKAILYCRPRNMPANIRTIVCGQIAGLIQFCKLAFTEPSLVKTKNTYFALKSYGRFVLMMTGTSKVWAESHLLITSKLLDSAVGGICLLWKETKHDYSSFVEILSSILDSIVFHALQDMRFEDGIFASSSVSTSLSSGLSPSSDLLEDFDSEKSLQEEEGGIALGILRKKENFKSLKNQKTDLITSSSVEENDDQCEHSIMTTLNREFTAVPSVPLPKSGGCAFLKAQQLFEVCQQHSGVLAGSIFFQNRVLSTQIEPELELVIASLNDNDSELSSQTNEILHKKNSSFELPKDVALYIFNLNEENLCKLNKSIPKISVRRRGRKGLHSEVHSKDLSSLRSTLQNQSLHSYPSSIPPYTDEAFNSEHEHDTQLKKSLDPALLCAKLSRNGDLLSDVRPSKSLPGSPRKIRVSTMLPDVGRDSPDLRYKILTTKRQKPGISSCNTPKKLSSMMISNNGKLNGQNNSNIHRGINNLSAPLLKRKDFIGKNEQSRQGNISDKNFQLNKENINSFGQNRLIENSSKMELNIKNTKNKLNLHFAPEKINRPHNDYDAEAKIYREINGNVGKDQKENRSGKSQKTSIIEIDDDEASKSEESEISVLELSSFLESKENGNKMFAEATRADSPKSDISEIIDEAVIHHACSFIEQFEFSDLPENSSENQWTKITLYVQKTSKMGFFLFLDKKASDNESLIYDLYQFASSSLSDIEKSVEKTLEMSEESEGDTYLRKTNSILTSSDVGSLSLPLVIETHRDFIANPKLTELTLRRGDKVVWGHRTCETETFYQSNGSWRPGLPIPSDDMSRIPHRARRRLERDYGITIL